MAIWQRRPPVEVLVAPPEQRIRYACWATIAILVWGWVGTIIAPGAKFSPWHLADYLIPGILILLYWRRSRFAAVALPAYFVGISAYQLFGLHQGIGYFQLAILGWFLVRGSKAIFESHRLQASGHQSPTPDAG